MAVEQIILDIRAQVDKAKKDISQLKTQVAGVNKEVTKSEGLFKKAAIALGGIFAVSRVIQWGKAMAKVAMDFEKSMANVITLLDEAQKKQLGTFLKRGAAELMGQYGLAIQDVNKALFDTISAGVKASESIKFLSDAAKLAIGGVTNLSTAVDGMTSVLNAYGLAAKDAEKISSAFFTAQKYGKTTVAELAQTIGMVAPMAKTAGVSFQELLSMMALLTKQGIHTEMAATALRATISALISPTGESAKQFKALGIETGITAIKENGFAVTLMQVAKAAQTDADVLSQLIPNVRALTGVAALGESALIEYDEILKEVTTDYGENSSLSAALEEQMSTLTEKIKEAGGAWRNFILSITEQERGAATEVINLWTFAFNTIAKLNRHRYEELGITHEEWVAKEIETINKVAEENEVEVTTIAMLRLKAIDDEIVAETDKYDNLNKRDKKEADIRIGRLLSGREVVISLIEEEIERKKKIQQDYAKAEEKALRESEERKYKIIRDGAKKRAAFSNYFMDKENREAEDSINARIDYELDETNKNLDGEMKVNEDALKRMIEGEEAYALASIEIEQMKQMAKFNIISSALKATNSALYDSAVGQLLMSIAESIISTYLTAQFAAQGMTMAIPGPAGVAAGEAARAQAIIEGWITTALIAAVSIPKFFGGGGYTGDDAMPYVKDLQGKPLAGFVHKKEFVFDEEKTKELRPFFEDIHSGRIGARELAALTQRGIIIPIIKNDFNSEILEREVRRIYSKMGEEKPQRYTTETATGYKKVIGNTTINIRKN